MAPQRHAFNWQSANPLLLHFYVTQTSAQRKQTPKLIRGGREKTVNQCAIGNVNEIYTIYQTYINFQTYW